MADWLDTQIRGAAAWCYAVDVDDDHDAASRPAVDRPSVFLLVRLRVAVVVPSVSGCFGEYRLSHQMLMLSVVEGWPAIRELLGIAKNA